MAPTHENGGDPAIRKVQLTGGSTYTVSLPKDWARAQDISAGSSLYLYSLADRVVVAPVEPTENGWRASVSAADLDAAAVRRHVNAAYVAGADEIVVEANDEPADGDELADDLRRAAREAVTNLVGMGVARETATFLAGRSMLDASEVSLEQTLAQLRQLVVTMHLEAIDAVLEDDEALAESVRERSGDVKRLVALVGRQFHAALVDVSAVDGLDTDRASAFRHVEVARALGRVAAGARRIAKVATEQSGAPAAEVATGLEAAGQDARKLVRTALGEQPRRAFAAALPLLADVADVEAVLRGQDHADVLLHAQVCERLRDAATQSEHIAATRLRGSFADQREA